MPASRCRIYELRVCARCQGTPAVTQGQSFHGLVGLPYPGGKVWGSPRSALWALLAGAYCELRGLSCHPPTAHLQTERAWDRRELGLKGLLPRTRRPRVPSRWGVPRAPEVPGCQREGARRSQPTVAKDTGVLRGCVFLLRA